MKKKIALFSILGVICILSLVFITSGFLKQYDISLESFSVKVNGSKISLIIKTKQSKHVRKIKVTQKGEKQYITFYSDFRLFNLRVGSKNEYEISLNNFSKEIYFDKGNGKFILVLRKNEETNKWEKLSENSFTDKEIGDMEYVDNEIKHLSSNDEYKEMSFENQVIEMEKVLKKLKEKQYIKYYVYSSDNYPFSFEYTCGVLGGVMMKDFDSILNQNNLG